MNFSWKNSITKVKLLSIMPKNKVNKCIIFAPSGAKGMQICLSALIQLSKSSPSALSSVIMLMFSKSCYNASVFFLFLDSGEYECKVDTDNGKTFKESFVLGGTESLHSLQPLQAYMSSNNIIITIRSLQIISEKHAMESGLTRI